MLTAASFAAALAAIWFPGPVQPSDRPFDLVTNLSSLGTLAIVTIDPGGRGSQRSFELGFDGQVYDATLLDGTIVVIISALVNRDTLSGVYTVDPASDSVRQICNSRFAGERLYSMASDGSVCVVAASQGLFPVRLDSAPTSPIVQPKDCRLDRGIAIVDSRCIFVSREAELAACDPRAPDKRWTLGALPDEARILTGHKDTVIYASATTVYARQLSWDGDQGRVIGERIVGPAGVDMLGAFVENERVWLVNCTEVPFRSTLWTLDGKTSIKSPQVFTKGVVVPR